MARSKTPTAEATATTQTLQARALAELQRVTEANEARNAQAERDDRAQRINEARALARQLGARPADVHADQVAGTVTIEGLVFKGARLVGRCPQCGAEATSEEIGTLYELGALLDTFTPRWGHQCKIPAEYVTPAPAPSIADQLVDLIRAIAREEAGSMIGPHEY